MMTKQGSTGYLIGYKRVSTKAQDASRQADADCWRHWTPCGRETPSVEFERDMIVERARVGREAAKARGRTRGRPSVVTEDVLTVAKAHRAWGRTSLSLARPLEPPARLPYRHLG